MSVIEVKVPDIGDFKQVEIIEVLIKVGDTIKADQSLITVESDKASMEIPSSHAGVVTEVKVKVGDKVAEGSLMVLVENSAGAANAPIELATSLATTTSTSPSMSASTVVEAPVAIPIKPPLSSLPDAAINLTNATMVATPLHASPSIRKLARDLGVNLARVPGTAPKGRISQEDVYSFIKGVMTGANASPVSPPTSNGGAGLNLLPWPSLDFSKFGSTELQPLSRIKKLSGPNLHRNWVMIPHVTQYDEADITALEEFRTTYNQANAKSGIKLTMLAFVIKASVSALKKFPAFNSSLDASGENLILKKYYNIGFAADTPNGLMVPVVKNVDQKTLSQIATEMSELSAQTREGKLKPADMQGATFTISSLGGIGSTGFTPIINAPEVAILGLSKALMTPVWNGKEFEPRLMMPMSLSYDHRVIDGAMGARFSGYVAELLGDLRKSLL